MKCAGKSRHQVEMRRSGLCNVYAYYDMKINLLSPGDSHACTYWLSLRVIVR
ncbi:hypothetical protein WN55_09279 [Dufourea novaeangliae]|uniref:Uncharacterized protein n=1 Tax=Dufourea novaeangliae TaxID=178035 RepID=A0A154P8Y1_DUFNO|nr:hypothetical protein WN55_09279 [Dufourea novaeangliae]